MLQTSQIEYKDLYYDVTITVKQGTFADGMKKAGLQGEALLAGAGADLGFGENLGLLIAYHVRPSCLAALVNVENRGELSVKPDPTIEEFMEYPDALITMWQEAVWELNPHWSPFGRNQTPQLSLTENSSNGTPQEA